MKAILISTLTFLATGGLASIPIYKLYKNNKQLNTRLSKNTIDYNCLNKKLIDKTTENNKLQEENKKLKELFINSIDSYSFLPKQLSDMMEVNTSQTNELINITNDFSDLNNIITKYQNHLNSLSCSINNIKDFIKTDSYETWLKLKETENSFTKEYNEVFTKFEGFFANVSNISELLKSISEVANRIKILSLNASIESARAGESGKGFAIISKEIRQLSDDTNDLCNKIIKNIDYLNKSSRTAESRSGKIKELLEGKAKQIKVVNDTYDKLNAFIDDTSIKYKEIIDSIQKVTNLSNSVNDKVSTLSAGVEELSASLDEINNYSKNDNSNEITKAYISIKKELNK